MKRNVDLHARGQRGLGAIAAILVLVVLAVIAAAVVRLASTQQTGFAQQLDAARAGQAAQAGLEWGLFRALRNGSCAASAGFDIAELGMHVNVSCSAGSFKEGLDDSGAVQARTVYTIDAVACNAATCPDAARAVTSTYVERRRRVQAVDG